MKDKRELRQLRRRYTRQFFVGNRWVLVIAILASLLNVGLNLALSWLIQQLMDTMAVSSGLQELLRLTLYACGLIVGLLTIYILMYFSKPRFLLRAMEQYKHYVIQELCKKSIASFQKETTAMYISALSNDAASIERDYLEKLFDLLTDILLFLGAFTMMLFYSPLLTLIAAGLSLLPVIASLAAGNRVAVEEKKVSDRNESFLATIKDCLNGFSVVKSFQAEREVATLIDKSNSAVEQAKCRRRKTAIVVSMLGSTAGFITQIGVFLFAAYLGLSGRGVTAGIALAFCQLMNYVIRPIAEVPQFLASRKASMALIDKLALALDSNLRDDGVTIPKWLERGIDVSYLTFAYEQGKTVLNDFNFSFEAGKSYAIVGGSGSGKTTLLNLLLAAHGDYSGAICYDGKELREISSQSLYDLISVVQQNVFVFNASIRDNITMFREFPKEAVDRAIRQSGLSALVEERGEEYLCGENGSGLSGGERQRISIARSLLRKSPVLLVDEATAALDKETANHVTSSILALEGLTRLVVTHALDAALLEKFDCIIALNNGTLVESGDFETLMRRKGYFYALYTVSQ